MKFSVIFLIIFCSIEVNATEVRCGWLVNPTPANLWLTDKDGDWIISAQGVANELDEESIDLAYKAIERDSDFVRTNVNYGFGCACLTVDLDKSLESIVKIHKGKQLALKQCLEDISLSKDIPLPFK